LLKTTEPQEVHIPKSLIIYKRTEKPEKLQAYNNGLVMNLKLRHCKLVNCE